MLVVKKSKAFLAALTIIAVGMIGYATAPIAAADTDGVCGRTETPYYMGALLLPVDTYDVYVKLGKPGQAAMVSGYARLGDDASDCLSIGTVEASGTEWRKLGEYTSGSDHAEPLFQLSSEILRDLPDANRPALMLVSRTQPVCVPTTECFATVAGQKAYIRPAGTSPESSSLRIVRVTSTDLRAITHVEYYADNELLYQTKTLEEFKTEDVPFYAKKLVRVAHYTSGQMAVIEEDASPAKQYDLWTAARPYLQRYRNTFVVIGVCLGLIVVARIVSGSIGYIQRRRRWKIDHGFIRDPADLAVTPEQIWRLQWRHRLKRVYRYGERVIIAVAAIVGAVFVTNTFLLQVGTVSGMSMYATLHDGQKILINKTPVTFARLNKTQYVPGRGAIVVASPNFGALDASIQQDGQSLIVKRVCGLPGERVVVNAGAYTIYNQEHPGGFDPNANTSWSVNIQPDSSTSHIDVQLAESELFLCGDNYPVSIDSRYNGPISTSQVVGVVSWY